MHKFIKIRVESLIIPRRELLRMPPIGGSRVGFGYLLGGQCRINPYAAGAILANTQ